jgi:hypothetical protein
MDVSWIIEIVKQIPALVVLVYLVKQFIDNQRERDKLFQQLNDNCHNV